MSSNGASRLIDAQLLLHAARAPIARENSRNIDPGGPRGPARRRADDPAFRPEPLRGPARGPRPSETWASRWLFGTMVTGVDQRGVETKLGASQLRRIEDRGEDLGSRAAALTSSAVCWPRRPAPTWIERAVEGRSPTVTLPGHPVWSSAT